MRRRQPRYKSRHSCNLRRLHDGSKRLGRSMVLATWCPFASLAMWTSIARSAIAVSVLNVGLHDAGVNSRLSSKRRSVGLQLVLRSNTNRARLRHQHVGQFVGFPKPVNNGCLDFIAVLDVNDVIHLGLRRPVASSHLRSLQCSTEENAEFEKIPLGTHEKVAGVAREHDRLVRGVNPLIPERNGCLAQPFPSVPQIVGELLR